ncbi:MAG: hypothetical protein CM15mP49_17930 [Actinomycetota bacterium]|nr:MAG: hypothetical protein CM15mP49_17930 [Actinomycetota bacterium]
MADTFEQLDENNDVRVSVLCSQGKHFCAGADFSGDSNGNDTLGLYAGAVASLDVVNPSLQRYKELLLWRFRTCISRRFSFCFSRSPIQRKLFSPGLSSGIRFERHVAQLIGTQASNDMFFTGRRVTGEEAAELGLCDKLVHYGIERRRYFVRSGNS